MPNLESRPDGPFIDSIHKSLSDSWSDARTNWRDSDRFVHRTYNVWDNTEHQVQRGNYRPSTPTSVINGASDQFLAYKLRIHREPLTDSDNSNTEASELEVALLAIIEDAFLQENQLPFKQAGKHLALYGYTNIHGPILDSSDLMEKPKRSTSESEEDYQAALASFQNERRHWNPIRIRAPHPARVLMPPRQKMPNLAIHEIEFEAGELHELSKKKQGGKKIANIFPYPDNPLEPVKALSFWTRCFRALKVKGGDLLYTQKNTWDFVPFGHGFAGFGIEPTDMDSWNPRHLAEGLLDPIKDSIRLQAQLANAKHELVTNKAYAIWGTNKDAAEFREMLAGGGIATGERSDYWVLDYPGADRALFETGREADEDIQLGTYQRLAVGGRAPGVTTVGQHAQMSTATQRKFTSAMAQLEHLATIVAQRILRLCDLEGPFKADGKVLHPDMIHHDYNVKASFEVRDPVMELQMRQLGLQEFGLGLLDDVTYWEDYGREENITKRRDRMLEMYIRRMPEVQFKMAEQVADGMGVGDVVREAHEARRLAGGGGGGEENGRSNVPQSQDIFNNALLDGSNSANPPEVRQAMSDDTAKQPRIDLGR